MNERIWIMGASDGIGAALARAWAARGARLILSARRAEALAAVAADCPGATIVTADVADRTSLEDAARQVSSGGPLDRAITLAALYDPAKVMEADPGEAARIVTVNLTGTLHFAQLAQPLLRPQGQLVLTGSVAGYVGLPQGQIYSATKAGVMNLAQTLRAELAGQTDVRLISPGFVDTRMTKRNDFAMPLIMSPEAAAAAILRGLDRPGFETHFPARLSLALKALRLLPAPLLMAVTRRLVR